MEDGILETLHDGQARDCRKEGLAPVGVPENGIGRSQIVQSFECEGSELYLSKEVARAKDINVI